MAPVGTVIVLLLCLSSLFLASNDPSTNEQDFIDSRPSAIELSVLAKKQAQLLRKVKVGMSIKLYLKTGDLTSVIHSAQEPTEAIKIKPIPNNLRAINLDMSVRYKITFTKYGPNSNKFSLRNILSLLSNELVDPRNRMFTSQEGERRYKTQKNDIPLSDMIQIDRFPHRYSHMAFIKPHMYTMCETRCQKYFRSIGRVIGIAILNKQFLDLTFTSLFYKYILGHDMNINDLEQIDEDMFHHLHQVSTNQTYVRDSTLFMTYRQYSPAQLLDLITNGSQVRVTEQNKNTYIDLTIKAYVKNHISPAMDALCTGLFEIIRKTELVQFNEDELKVLISGNTRIDIDDWQSYTHVFRNVIGDLYMTNFLAKPLMSKQLNWFWELVKKFNLDTQSRLLLYVTGTSRLPISGFKGWHSIGSGDRWFNINFSRKPKNIQSSAIYGYLWLPTLDPERACGYEVELKHILNLKGGVCTWYTHMNPTLLYHVHGLIY